MLLGQKKTLPPEQNWFVVLNPIANEIDKKKVSERIVEVFALSPDEALDLVSNTPIILLDNLTKPIAGKLRDYFKVAGANLTLSNDTLYKRKCYRTIWPQQPNLGFLHQFKEEARQEKESSQELLDPDEALNEIRSLSVAQDPPAAPTGEPVEIWHLPETKMSDESISSHEDEKEKFDHEPSEVRSYYPPAQEASVQQNPKIKELQAKLNNLEDKYESLKEEYRLARGVFDEKLISIRKENQNHIQKYSDLSARYEVLEKERVRLQEQLAERERVYLHLNQEKESLRGQFETRFRDVQKEAENAAAQYQKAQEEIAELKKETEKLKADKNKRVDQLLRESAELEKKYQDAEVQLEQLRLERQGLQSQVEKGAVEGQREFERLKKKYEAAQNEIHNMLEEKKRTEKHFEDCLAEAKTEYDVLKKKYQRSQNDVETLKFEKAGVESRLAESSVDLENLNQKIDVLNESVEAWRSKAESEKQAKEHMNEMHQMREADYKKTIREYEQTIQNLQEKSAPSESYEKAFYELKQVLQAQTRLLESMADQFRFRDKRLDQLEQQIVSKKESSIKETAQINLTQLTSRLQDKEGFLKRLVQEQQGVEKEIKEREASLKKLLLDQEVLEKEILEVKQAQRQYKEQVLNSNDSAGTQ